MTTSSSAPPPAPPRVDSDVSDEVVSVFAPQAASRTTPGFGPEPTATVAGPEKELPLDEESVEKIRKAMMLLVKHRGGGPFGMGRLEKDEVNRVVAVVVEPLLLRRCCAFFNGPFLKKKKKNLIPYRPL